MGHLRLVSKLDGINYQVWSKILEMHIVGREKKVTLLEEKVLQEKMIQLLINGNLKMPYLNLSSSTL